MKNPFFQFKILAPNNILVKKLVQEENPSIDVCYLFVGFPNKEDNVFLLFSFVENKLICPVSWVQFLNYITDIPFSIKGVIN